MPSIIFYRQLEASLKASGVKLEYKYRRGTNEIQGLSFIRKGKRFPASKIDRRFSFGSIKVHLAKNKPQHPQSSWMYADGTNPDAPAQSQGHNNFGLYGGASQSPTEEDPCTVSGGDNETWPEFRRRYPDMPIKQALAAFRAKKRGKNLNGGSSMGGLR